MLVIALPLALAKTLGSSGIATNQSTGGIGKVGVHSTSTYQNTTYQSAGGIGKVGMQSTGAITSYKPAYQNRQAAATNNRNSNIKSPRPVARIMRKSNVVRY